MTRYRASVMAWASVSALTLAAHAQAQSAPVDAPPETLVPAPAPAAADKPGNGDIIVTGSRIVRNGNNAPTPVTVISTDRAALTTPTNVPDALNKMPAFSGSKSPGTIATGTNPGTGNYLNLRAFGINRTLILLDGHRVAPTSYDGTVNVDVLPQMLMQRVDVVTGGASAVYGSDAVTGVVNFILDKHFTGLKMEAQSGISQYGDDASYKAGIAYGAKLFEGKGHFIASYERTDRKGIPNKYDRPYGQAIYQEAGNGTAASPYHLISNGRISNTSFGGILVQGSGAGAGTLPASLKGMQFLDNGTIGAFNAGAATGNSNLSSGGDGGYVAGNAATAPLTTNQAFARLEYEVSDTTTAFVQGYWATAENAYHGMNLARPYSASTVAASTATTATSSNAINIYSGNPYLPASVQSAMTANGVNYFGLGRYDGDIGNLIVIDAKTTSYAAIAGIQGKLGTWNWDASVNYGVGKIHDASLNNENNERFYAAIDAVRAPNGNIVCRVTLTNPGLYPGCVPMNILGNGQMSQASINYVLGTNQWWAKNSQTDVAANISGTAFHTWAGPVSVGFSGEYRRLRLDETTDSDPNTPFDPTGLRGGFTSQTLIWTRSNVAPTQGTMEVKEGNIEVAVPLLKDVPFFKYVELNGAARYTDYSTTGSVVTWKAGLSWQVYSDLRLRATRSRDIRAPSLFDLYAGTSGGTTGFTDLHTGVAGFTRNSAQGNPNLVPEVAQTLTLGGVWTPAQVPGFSVSVDFYNIKINNAITQIGGNTTIAQTICEQSNGTSNLCNLYVRPLPFSNNTAANYPTLVLTENLNIAQTSTKGVDVEVGYRSDLSRLSAKLPGSIDLRLLASYQPDLLQKTLPSAPTLNMAGTASNGPGLPAPQKFRLTFDATYAVSGFSINGELRYLSGLKPNADPTLIYSDPDIPSVIYVDLGLTYNVKVGKGVFTPFLTINNLFNKQPPLFASTAFTGNPGFYYPVPTGYDITGRYFTAGVRAKF